MLKLFLDEHLSPTVADGLRRRDRLLVVSCMAEWEEGEFLGQQDSACLQQAAAQGLTLVTYDRRAIPPLLKVWAEEERKPGGVIFVDEKTLSPSEALINLSRKPGNATGPIESASCGVDRPSKSSRLCMISREETCGWRIVISPTIPQDSPNQFA